MATIQSRVEDFVGTISDTAALTHWLTEAARRLVDLIPEGTAERYASSVSFTGDALAMTNYRVFSVWAGGVLVRRIPLAQVSDVGDSDSIYYATERDPVCWINLGSMYVRPTDLDPTATVIARPTTVDYSASSISGYPVEFEEPVILDAACKAQMQAIEAYLRVTLSGITFSAETIAAADALAVTTPTALAAAGVVDLSTYSTAITGLVSAISTGQALVTGYIATNFDIELAEGKLRQIDRYLGEAGMQLQQMQTLVAEFSAEQKEEIDTYLARVQQEGVEIAAYNANQQVRLAVLTARIQQEVSRFQNVLAQAKERVGGMILLLKGLREMYGDALRMLGVPMGEQKQ